jgi:hypothetical protein
VTAARKLALAALCAAAPCASAFTVEVGEVIGLLDIEVTATALDAAVVLKIVNHEPVAAECELRIDSGPEEQLRRVLIGPLEQKVVTQRIRPSTQRVRVDGVCR